MGWPVEEIPVDADHYRFVHLEQFRDDDGVRLDPATGAPTAEKLAELDVMEYAKPQAGG